jgi:formate dehydrogenase subunit gamma
MNAALPCASSPAHTHIGTVGMEGAFDAIGTGKVDLDWARDNSCDIQRQPTA